MSEENGTSTTSVTTPVGSFSFSGKRMAEFISVLLLCLMGVLSYAFWTHSTDDKDQKGQLISVLKEINAGNMAVVKEQRIMNCILTLRQEDRRTALQDCERIAR